MNFKQKNTGFIFLVFIFVFLVIYLLTSPFLQLKSYNILTKFTLNNKISNDKVVLVTIDDKSLHEIGRWPWKREYYLEIFNFFENYTDAKLIGYDALIASPDTENSKSDKKFFSNVKKYNKLTAGVAFSNNEFEKGTNKEALDKLLFSKTDDIRIIDKRSKKYQTKGSFKSFTLLEDEYFKNIKSLGSVDVILDSDGYVRQVGQLISYQENFFPSMGLSLFSKYYNMKDFIITDKYLWGFSKESALKVPIENIKADSLEKPHRYL